MDSWNSSTWWGLVVLVWVLLAIPLLSSQATDELIEKKNPHLAHQNEKARTNTLSWLWIAGLVVLLLSWSVFQ